MVGAGSGSPCCQRLTRASPAGERRGTDRASASRPTVAGDEQDHEQGDGPPEGDPVHQPDTPEREHGPDGQQSPAVRGPLLGGQQQAALLERSVHGDGLRQVLHLVDQGAGR